MLGRSGIYLTTAEQRTDIGGMQQEEMACLIVECHQNNTADIIVFLKDPGNSPKRIEFVTVSLSPNQGQCKLI